MIDNELLNLLNQIKTSIERGDIKGYKDLLYLINQTNHMNNPEVSGILNDFIELLFRDNIIIESCGPGQCDNMPPQEMRNHEDLTRGKEKPTPMEPLDIKVLDEFHGIIPLAIIPSLRENIKERFNHH